MASDKYIKKWLPIVSLCEILVVFEAHHSHEMLSLIFSGKKNQNVFCCFLIGSLWATMDPVNFEGR